jgi:hypothetical protein
MQMNEYLECYNYLSPLGQAELRSMIRYLICKDIIRPNNGDFENFTFTFTVNKSIEEIGDSF